MGTSRTQTGHRRILRFLVVTAGIVAFAILAAGCQSQSGDDGSGGLSSSLTSSAVGEWDSWGGTPPALEDLDGRLDLTPEQAQPMQDALGKWIASRPAADERHRSRQGHGDRRGPRGGRESDSDVRGGAHTFLIDCAAFLDADQMVGLIEYLKERRDERHHARPEGGRGHDRGGRTEGRLTRILEQMELTDAQVVQVTTLFEEHQAAMEEFRAQWAEDDRPDADVREQMRALRQGFHERLEAIVGVDNMSQLKNHSSHSRRGKRDRSGSGAHRGSGRSIEFLAAVLHLTEAQRAQIDQIFATAQAAREAIREAVSDGEFPSDDVIGELDQLREETDAAIRGIMTPEQLRVYQALQEMIGKRGHGMHRP